MIADDGKVCRTEMSPSSGAGEAGADDRLCISDTDVLRLCRIGVMLEEIFGFACDIEWAITKGIIYLLQVKL